MKKPDPRAMLLIAACFSTMGVLIESTWLLACVLLAAVLFSIVLGANMMRVLKRLRGFILVIVFVALMQSIFNGGGRTLVSIGNVSILTTEGLLRGTNTLLRLSTVMASASIFTLTTPRRMVQGLIQLKIPYEFAFMTSVALRFLPVFSQEFRDTLVAIQLRGVDIKRIPFQQKLKMYTSILMPVTYGAVDRAQKLSCTMELRAFRSHDKRTSRFVLKFAAIDYVYMLVLPIATAGILTYYYLFI